MPTVRKPASQVDRLARRLAQVERELAELREWLMGAVERHGRDFARLAAEVRRTFKR